MSDIAGQPIHDTRAWRGAELAQTAWVTHLSTEQIKALYEVADALPSDDASWLDCDVREIMRPAASELLGKARDELATGKGFVLLRGLDASDTERLHRVFWIIGNGLGEPVMQNARGEVLSIVADRFAGAERGVPAALPWRVRRRRLPKRRARTSSTQPSTRCASPSLPPNSRSRAVVAPSCRLSPSPRPGRCADEPSLFRARTRTHARARARRALSTCTRHPELGDSEASRNA